MRISCLFALALLLLTAPILRAQDAATPDSSDVGTEPLAERQRQLAERYEQLEQILLRMSELSAASDPRRAALLTKAVAESKERLIGIQFASLVDQLSSGELAKAVEGQEMLEADLGDLLDLLLSENRSKRLASEKARIRQYLRDLNRIINQQKSLQARTTGGTGQPEQLSRQQGEIGEQTGGLAEEIRKNEETQAGPSNEKPGDRESAGGQSSGNGKEDDRQQKPDDGGDKPSDSGEGSKSGDAQAKPSEEEESGGKPESADGAPSEKPADKPSSDSQQSGRQSGGSPPQSQSESSSENAHPARQRLESARKRMQQAQQRLKQAEREGASEEQEEAIRELQQAKAELEEILRQLREEEIEQVLVALEARFLKMLQMQREVYEGTERLDKASADGLTHEQEIEAGRLSSREAEIVAEADKALMLLREDGSAVAIPEALRQAREDMQEVVTRLGRASVGQITLGIEEDIITALDEMLEAVRKAMEDAQQRRQNAQPGQPGTPQDPPLVDALAELRMIRSLQLRVNKRTERYGKMISGEHAETPELIEALERLADRQDRIYRITNDLESGRNR